MRALRRGLEPVAAHASVDEVIGPDVVLVPWPEPHARSIVQPEALSLRLLGWDLQPLAPPYACNPFVIYMPALSAQQCVAIVARTNGAPMATPPIAIATILTSKADDR